MDSSHHKLIAPNEEELRTIEQLEDHSGLSTLYREPGEQFEGDILSASDREKKQAEKYDAVTRSIWKYSLKLGLYVPFPFISGILLAATLYYTVTWANAAVFIGLIILAVGTWLLLSYGAYTRIFKVFYKHGMRTGPFLLVMLPSVLIASQAIYDVVVMYFAGQSLIFNLAIVSIFVILYSIIASLALLLAWGYPKLETIYKIAVGGLILLISGLLATGSYLF